jgi:hypothetical protein
MCEHVTSHRIAAYERGDQNAESITLSRVSTAFDYSGGIGAFGTPAQLAFKLAPNGTVVSAREDDTCVYRIEAYTEGRHCFFAIALKQRQRASRPPLLITLTASTPTSSDSSELSETLQSVANSFSLVT